MFVHILPLESDSLLEHLQSLCKINLNYDLDLQSSQKPFQSTDAKGTQIVFSSKKM